MPPQSQRDPHGCVEPFVASVSCFIVVCPWLSCSRAALTSRNGFRIGALSRFDCCSQLRANNEINGMSDRHGLLYFVSIVALGGCRVFSEQQASCLLVTLDLLSLHS